jgi:hypothetical protein
LGNCKLRWLFLDTLGIHFDQILTLKHLSHKHHHVTITFEEPKFSLLNLNKIVKIHLHYIQHNEMTRL